MTKRCLESEKRDQHFLSFSRETYLKTEVFWWSILFILFHLRPFNDFLLFHISQEKHILTDFYIDFPVKSVIDTISSIFRILRIFM